MTRAVNAKCGNCGKATVSEYYCMRNPNKKWVSPGDRVEAGSTAVAFCGDYCLRQRTRYSDAIYQKDEDWQRDMRRTRPALPTSGGPAVWCHDGRLKLPSKPIGLAEALGLAAWISASDSKKASS